MILNVTSFIQGALVTQTQTKAWVSRVCVLAPGRPNSKTVPRSAPCFLGFLLNTGKIVGDIQSTFHFATFPFSRKARVVGALRGTNLKCSEVLIQNVLKYYFRMDWRNLPEVDELTDENFVFNGEISPLSNSEFRSVQEHGVTRLHSGEITPSTELDENSCKRSQLPADSGPRKIRRKDSDTSTAIEQTTLHKCNTNGPNTEPHADNSIVGSGFGSTHAAVPHSAPVNVATAPSLPPVNAAAATAPIIASAPQVASSQTLGAPHTQILVPAAVTSIASKSQATGGFGHPSVISAQVPCNCGGSGLHGDVKHHCAKLLFLELRIGGLVEKPLIEVPKDRSFDGEYSSAMGQLQCRIRYRHATLGEMQGVINFGVVTVDTCGGPMMNDPLAHEKHRVGLQFCKKGKQTTIQVKWEAGGDGAASTSTGGVAKLRLKVRARRVRQNEDSWEFKDDAGSGFLGRPHQTSAFRFWAGLECPASAAEPVIPLLDPKDPNSNCKVVDLSAVTNSVKLETPQEQSGRLKWHQVRVWSKGNCPSRKKRKLATGRAALADPCDLWNQHIDSMGSMKGNRTVVQKNAQQAAGAHAHAHSTHTVSVALQQGLYGVSVLPPQYHTQAHLYAAAAGFRQAATAAATAPLPPQRQLQSSHGANRSTTSENSQSTGQFDFDDNGLVGFDELISA
jgi:hypothetical protein